jgi:hypothetical protein
MNMQALSAAVTIEGETLTDAMLDARDMAYMNFAREEFNKLVQILWPLLDPLLCHEENVVASDIARHIEQVRSFSGNFCWRHRHLGASCGVVGKGDD